MSFFSCSITRTSWATILLLYLELKNPISPAFYRALLLLSSLAAAPSVLSYVTGDLDSGWDSEGALPTAADVAVLTC